MRKALVLYYSWSNGNTERVAARLAEAAGADLERIRTVDPYPEDYDETVEQGRSEVEEGFEPELEPLEHDPSDYDVIAVGTPTWWYTMAPAVASLLSAQDLAGKLVVPFMTNAGWPGSVIEDMTEAAAPATVIEPMEVRFDSNGGSRMVTSQDDVDAWAGRIAKLVR
jgi:flavodoxin